MEFVETQAIYQQVADHVCEMILRGTWQEDERIPSVRELAMELQVNPNTVNKAYAYLQDSELIFNQRGIGYFVSENAVDRTRAIKRDEFYSHELPRLFKTMDLLGITVDDVAEQYQKHQAGG
jgi:DNA-binding transcriptional regulator YhcF (GntR family)